MRNRFALVLILAAYVAAPISSAAAGRVYAREQVPVCQAIATIGGVYAVYARHDALARSLTYDVVLKPGQHASDIAAHTRAILAAQPAEKFVLSIDAEIYTFHDPNHSVDFRKTFNAGEFMTSVYGFPDYRGSRVIEVHASYDPATGAQQGGWTITRVYDDPARLDSP